MEVGHRPDVFRVMVGDGGTRRELNRLKAGAAFARLTLVGYRLGRGISLSGASQSHESTRTEGGVAEKGASAAVH